MKKAILLLFILSNWAILGQSKQYSGIVKLKGDKTPFPGVLIVAKGTDIKTESDFYGKFEINVPDSVNVLIFSAIGIQTLEYKLDAEKNIEIFIKEDCNIDWFDERHIGFYINSGLLNNPIGGQFHFSFTPNFSFPTIKTGISYQTNLKENKYLSAYLNLHHLFVSCDFNADINSSYKNVEFNNDLKFTTYSVETSLNFNKISAIIGISSLEFNKVSENRNINSVGPTFGLGTWIGQPFLMSISARTTIYKNLSEYQAEIKKRYKGIYGFLKFNKIEEFSELSLGIGIELSY